VFHVRRAGRSNLRKLEKGAMQVPAKAMRGL
jgi:hypothetical protein